MDEIRERVAKALYDAEYGSDDTLTSILLFGKQLTWDQMIEGVEDGRLIPIVRDTILKRADIAIKAVMETMSPKH